MYVREPCSAGLMLAGANTSFGTASSSPVIVRNAVYRPVTKIQVVTLCEIGQLLCAEVQTGSYDTASRQVTNPARGEEIRGCWWREWAIGSSCGSITASSVFPLSSGYCRTHIGSIARLANDEVIDAGLVVCSWALIMEIGPACPIIFGYDMLVYMDLWLTSPVVSS